MIKFLTKGLLRDRSRSLFPIIVITLTVTLVVFSIGFMKGMMNSVFLDTAVISSGHTKIVTRAYKEESQQLPNDLALLDVNKLVSNLNSTYTDYFWTPRITFGGLLDVPDETGETKTQGPIFALGIDLLSKNSRQREIWKLDRFLVDGTFPTRSDDALISTKLAHQLDISPGDQVTVIASTMENAFATYNFNVVGTFNLRKGQVDKQMILVDISGARLALDMENAASEILGFTNTLYYNDEEVVELRTSYNSIHSDTNDIYSPVMLALRDVNQMGAMVDFNDAALAIMGGVFLLIVMIVLWNMGLMNGLRRYGEVGLRLAMGESKGQVYRSMITEAFLIGFVGTIMGTSLGLAITYYVQINGIDYTKGIEAMNGAASSIVMPNVFYAHVTPDLYYVGFFPGVLATVLGTMLAGLGIYKREMAQLFKELEN